MAAELADPQADGDTVSFELRRSYRFEAAHWLPEVTADHPCRKMHGHSYEVEVAVRGELGPGGWVIDFAVIDTVLEPLIAALDHTCLNEVAGLKNPTSELLAHWLWQRIEPELAGLAAVCVAETASSRVTYDGSD
jgi:6-pyruvoyltetrahydropterin/6-carboxytetrahydropterin synthase